MSNGNPRKYSFQKDPSSTNLSAHFIKESMIWWLFFSPVWKSNV